MKLTRQQFTQAKRDMRKSGLGMDFSDLEKMVVILEPDPTLPESADKDEWVNMEDKKKFEVNRANHLKRIKESNGYR